MVTNRVENQPASVSISDYITFAGDGVCLAGQMDFPHRQRPKNGYPLIFVIQHATCTSRHGYTHIAKLGTECGAAVFRWDKRGTGRSGAGGSGSVTIDTLKAYETAVTQGGIDPQRVVIFAQNEGTLLLGEAFREFAAIQKPRGVILASNMLDEKHILSIQTPLHIIVSKNDWNAWQIYAQAASEIHEAKYGFPSSFYVATNTNRRLMYLSGNAFHRGAEASIKHWLKHTCQILA